MVRLDDMKITLLIVFFFAGVGAGAWWAKADIKVEDGDCVIEQYSDLLGSWDEVILVHGFGENYNMSKKVIEGLQTMPKARNYRVRLIEAD